MTAAWAQTAPAALSAFLASLVECVEALTIVLAVGTVRGWRGAIAGTALALAILLLMVLALGPALTLIPLAPVRIVVGGAALWFGIRWLRKAVRRAAGVLPLRDEARAYGRETERLRAEAPARQRFDREALWTSFRITMLEGIEVVFIVVAIGAGGRGLLLPASAGALAALAAVILLGIALHRPLAAVPENTLKFAVGVMLCAFGTFWLGEGVQLPWPGGDGALLALIAGWLTFSLLAVRVLQVRTV